MAGRTSDLLVPAPSNRRKYHRPERHGHGRLGRGRRRHLCLQRHKSHYDRWDHGRHRNVISGNNGVGIELNGQSADDPGPVENLVVEGNDIGTDITGAIAIGNGTTGNGITINASNADTIGGTAARGRQRHLGQHGRRRVAHRLRHDRQRRRGQLHRHRRYRNRGDRQRHGRRDRYSGTRATRSAV